MDSPITKPDELVALAKALRAEGCIRCKWGDIELELLHPEKAGMSALSDEIADLPTEQREELLSSVKRQLNADLFGASG